MSKFELNVTKLKKSCVNCREYLDNYKKYCDRIYDNLKMIKNSWTGIDSDTFCKIFSNDFVEYEELYQSINKKQKVLDQFASKLEHFITENGYSQDEGLILYFDSNEINKCYSLFDRIDEKARHADEKICIDYWNCAVDCDKLNEVLEKIREANSESSTVKDSISTLQNSIEQLFSTDSINSDTLSVFTINNQFIEYSSPAVSYVKSFYTSNGSASNNSSLSVSNVNSDEVMSTTTYDVVDNSENFVSITRQKEMSEEDSEEKITAVFEQQRELDKIIEKEDNGDRITPVFEQQRGLDKITEKEDNGNRITSVIEQQSGLDELTKKEDDGDKITTVFDQQNGLDGLTKREDEDIIVSEFMQETKDGESKMGDEGATSINTLDEINASEKIFQNEFLDKDCNPEFNTLSGINTDGNIETVGMENFKSGTIQKMDSIDADSIGENVIAVDSSGSKSSLQGLDHDIDQINDI